ncbi:MAG: preQ(1) synthase [Selenomonadaceae bacterium]|nr:preQ(1) synthase [Selenomonadaceae bacterium]
MQNNFKSLGRQTDYAFDYNPAVLEAIDNKNSARNYFIKLNCEEFTCVCPITHQPDYARLEINYIPDQKLVESKSLKLYLTSFRNCGTFHEDVINIIADDLIKLLAPRYLEIVGHFAVRGGIAIEPFVNYANDEFKAMAQKRLEGRD